MRPWSIISSPSCLRQFSQARWEVGGEDREEAPPRSATPIAGDQNRNTTNRRDTGLQALMIPRQLNRPEDGPALLSDARDEHRPAQDEPARRPGRQDRLRAAGDAAWYRSSTVINRAIRRIPLPADFGGRVKVLPFQTASTGARCASLAFWSLLVHGQQPRRVSTVKSAGPAIGMNAAASRSVCVTPAAESTRTELDRGADEIPPASFEPPATACEPFRFPRPHRTLALSAGTCPRRWRGCASRTRSTRLQALVKRLALDASTRFSSQRASRIRDNPAASKSSRILTGLLHNENTRRPARASLRLGAGMGQARGKAQHRSVPASVGSVATAAHRRHHHRRRCAFDSALGGGGGGGGGWGAARELSPSLHRAHHDHPASLADGVRRRAFRMNWNQLGTRPAACESWRHHGRFLPANHHPSTPARSRQTDSTSSSDQHPARLRPTPRPPVPSPSPNRCDRLPIELKFLLSE